jgi:hypothetical protein
VKTKPFLIVGFLALCAASSVACTGEDTVPDQLLGVWKTSEPKYADCKIELLEQVLILKLATGVERNYGIDRIESDQETGRAVRYTVHYRDCEGRESRLKFLYDPSSGGTLKLKNHAEIWKKTD